MGGDKASLLAPDVLDPEMLDLADPAATWIKLAPHEQVRIYHSWALLLPDGRLLHGGGRKVITGPTPPYYHAQVSSPPYDKGGAGPPGRKARFDSGNPTSMPYGSQTIFQLADDPAAGLWEFELIRPGSMTHTVDFDQRMVILAHQDLGGGAYQVTAPASADLAPPGWYMLFAVSNRGIPSLAHFVHLP
jgi:hypothetical protein